MEEVRFAQQNANVYRRSQLSDLMTFYRNLNTTARHAAKLERALEIGIEPESQPEPETNSEEPDLLDRAREIVNEIDDYLGTNYGKDRRSTRRLSAVPSAPAEGASSSVFLNITALFGNNSRQQEIAASKASHPSVWNGQDSSS
jgi:hypothetical protein